MTHLSLFSGIGGIDLAAEWAGFRTVAFVERDEYCQKVLAKHWPEVPIYNDVTTFDGTGFRGVSLVSGGFPCQDISTANKQATGLEGSRSGLWFEMLRIVGEARPAFVVAENVRNLLNMGIDVCLAGLEALGYEATAVVVPAAGVGAWHRRDRIFIIGADFDGMGGEPGNGAPWSECELHDDQERKCQVEEQAGHDEFRGAGPDADGPRFARPETNSGGEGRPESASRECNELLQGFGERSFVFESKLCGDVHRFPGGLDALTRRLRALGNAVVPQQVYPILKAIADEIGGGE